MIRVCILKNEMNQKDGSERVAAMLANVLSDYFEVHFVCIHGKDEEISFPLDENVHYQALLSGHHKIRKILWSAVRELRRYLQNHEIKVVLAIGATQNVLC